MLEFSELAVCYLNWATYELDYQLSDIPVKDVSEIMYAFAQVGNCKAPYATDNNPGLCNSDGTYFTYSTDPYSDFNHVPEDYPNDWDGRKREY